MIQEDNTSYCGQLSIYFLYLMNFTDKSFHDIVLDIHREVDIKSQI